MTAGRRAVGRAAHRRECVRRLDVRTHRAGRPEPGPPGRRTGRSTGAAALAHMVAARPGRLLGRRGRHRPPRCRDVSLRAGPRPGCSPTLRRAAGRCRGAASAGSCWTPRWRYGRGCLRGDARGSSEDPLAVRRYRLAGFTLHPSMLLCGRRPAGGAPGRGAGPRGLAGDIDLMNSVDRQVRGSAHGVDHELLPACYRLVVADRSTGSGYAYVAPVGRALPAGGDQPAHRHRPALGGRSPRPTPERTVDGRQRHGRQRVGRRRGDGVPDGALDTSGYLALRGMKPPAPYLPSGYFL